MLPTSSTFQERKQQSNLIDEPEPVSSTITKLLPDVGKRFGRMRERVADAAPSGTI